MTAEPEDIPATSVGILTIDLEAIASNWRTLRAKLGPDAECAATIKANAYGHGLQEVARRLALEGCGTFFVAVTDEAIKVRSTLPEAVIYVLDGLFPGTEKTLAENDLRPVLGSREELEDWASFCRSSGRKSAAAIHVDTGMNRLGLRAEEVLAALEDPGLIDAASPSLLMSHLACGSEPAHPLNARQQALFAEVSQRLPGIPRSLANSAGVFLGPDYHFDLARPGIALYGGRALDSGPNPMTAAAKVEARVMSIRHVPKGEAIGYAATKTAPCDMRIATVSAGYADGLLRRAGSTDKETGGYAWYKGYDLPITGRISMDMMALDVTDVPEGILRRGDLVEMLGPNVPAADLAGTAQTIDYEYFTSLGHRFTRVYGPLTGN